MRRRGIVLILTLILAGCGRGLPQVTPTVAPTMTPTAGSTDVSNVPTQTPIVRLTNTAMLTLEATLTSTFTPPPPTNTNTVTLTGSATSTPTYTPTPQPSEEAPSVATTTPTFTPTPPPPTNTPTATFTPRPTNTVPPPTATFTPTLTPQPTLTPILLVPTFTWTPSNTPTNTPSYTPTRPTATPTRRPTQVAVVPTVTLTPQPSSTPSPIPATNTPLPTETFPPTITPTFIPSNTPLPPAPTNTLPPPATFVPPTNTVTPSPTLTDPPPTNTPGSPPPPTLTPTFDLTLSAIIQLTLIREGQLTQTALPTWTPVPTNAPTRTLEGGPTQDVTPNLVTATPGGPSFPDNVNGVTSTPAIDENATLATDFPTAQPTPTNLPPEIIQRGAPTPLPVPRYTPYTTTTLSTYRFSVQPGTTFAFNGSQITGGFSQFAANPAFPGSFVYIDLAGIIHFSPPGGSETPLNESPFFEGFEAASVEENKNRVRDIGWAPNGQQYFFIVDPPNSIIDKQGAGLWYWQPVDAGAGRTYELLVDCMPGYEATSCQLVQNRPSDYWQSLKGQWSSDSNRVLVTLYLPTEGRQALTIVNAVTDHGYKINAPEFARYDYGYFTPDGRVVVSGRQQDGRVIVGITDGNLGNMQTLLDASSANLWMRDAFMRPDGNIVAFGREGGADGPVRLYLIQNGSAIALTGDIGTTTPVRIDVADDGTQAVVSVDGTQYTVNPTAGTAFATELRTEGYGPPGGFEGGGSTDIPTSVLPNSRYSPGQQVQMVDIQRRNVRNQPGTNSTVIDYVDPNEYVGILAGPYDTEGLTWWYVNTARNQQGWFAGQQGDISFLNP